MKILFTRFPFVSAPGGAENQTIWLAAGLRERGHDVSFLGNCLVLLPRFARMSEDVSQLNIGKPPVTKWLALSFLWRSSAMRKSLMNVLSSMPKPDVIIMLSLSEKILLTEWAHNHGIKVLWLEHDRIGPWLTRNPWLSKLRRLSRLVTTVCVSELSASMYRKLGFDSGGVIAIPNGVPERNSKFQKENSKEHEVLRLGCIARLSQEKGVDVLIESIAEIPEVNLSIVGTGGEEGYLRTLIAADTERMGGERIELHPTVPDLDAYYASLDALVLPSREHDPFGLVAAEAMVRGIPVIVTSACGIAGYLIDGEHAVIVTPEDSNDLARAIRRLLDPVLRAHLAKNGEERARKLFSLPSMIDAYEAVLKD